MSKRTKNRSGKVLYKSKLGKYHKQTKGAFGKDKVAQLHRHGLILRDGETCLGRWIEINGGLP